MSSDKPTRLDTKVRGIKEHELLYVLNQARMRYIGSDDGTEISFNRDRMVKAVGTVFEFACIEAFANGNSPFPTFECPNRWPCDRCSVAKKVADSRVRIATNRPKLP